jgi:hypothetical protein
MQWVDGGTRSECSCIELFARTMGATLHQTEYVASILSRRAGLLGLMRDLDNTALAGGLAFLDLEDEVFYGREGKVWAVAEDGVAGTGKLHQAGGLRR